MNNTLPPSVAAFFPDAVPVWPAAIKAGKPLNDIDQIAIVVSDIDAAIEYFGAAFGLGPFYIVSYEGNSGRDGESSDYSLKMAFTQVGAIEVELLQVLAGETPHRGHLQAKGEGLFHLRIKTEHLEDDLQALAEQGIKSEWDIWVGDALINATVDSHRRFGLRVELMRSSELLHSTLRATQAANVAGENKKTG